MLGDFKNEISQILPFYTSAKNILIVSNENPDLDTLASCLALYGTFKNIGKTVQIACPTDLTVEFSDLVGIAEIKKELDGKNFIISWDYQDGSIEKVSYNIENSRFNLVIQPRSGHEFDITADKIDFRKAGSLADLIFVVGCESIALLNKLYIHEQDLSSKVNIINIDKSSNNQNFGKINIIFNKTSSFSEFIAELIAELGLKIDNDSATNILTGIDFITKNLTIDDLKPETLEIAAWCLKNGGIRVLLKKSLADKEKTEVIEQVLKLPKQADDGKKGQEVPSPDWLQPKIYHGTSLV